MAKAYYKNKLTGRYGILEEQLFPNQSTYLRLRLLIPVGGMAELSERYENVTAENLVKVSREEVQKGMGF